MGSASSRANHSLCVSPQRNTHGTTSREWSRVFYSIDLRIPSWIPGFVVNILNTQALTSVSKSQEGRKEGRSAPASLTADRPDPFLLILLRQATAWVKTQSEKTFAPTLKAKAAAAAQQAAAAEAAAAAESSSGGSAGSGGQQRRRYGGGDLWEGFIEEFSDLLDTEKYAAKVAARTKRREEKAQAKAQTAKKEKQQQKHQQEQRDGKGGGASEQDDARRLLVFVWLAVLAYGLLQLWRDMEEDEQDKPARLKPAPAAPAAEAVAGGAVLSSSLSSSSS